MLLFQLSFLFVSFSFFGSPAQTLSVPLVVSPSVQVCTPCDLLCFVEISNTQVAEAQLRLSQLSFDDNIENENCFHELNEALASHALKDDNQQVYAILDTLAQISDGYVSEALGGTLAQLFNEDTADFLDYYLEEASTDFQFLFLFELERNFEMESEDQVEILKAKWISVLRSYDASPEPKESFNELMSQIENL